VAQMRDGSALIERNLHRAVDLVKNFKQVAADQASEQRRRFDLAAVAHEVLDTLNPSLKRYTHTVELDIAKGLMFDSYPGALGQVLINLINNAYLHAFEGRSDGRVRVHAVGQGDGVDIELSDNGWGMTPEHLAQLFQPFFSTKIGRGGTGLGTTIVENLVTRVLGGTLRVESTVGQGTTYHIHLPLQAPDHTP
jgi:signal transduction histidine kinase